MILTTQKRPNFACGNYIFPKTRGNKNKPWIHSTPLNTSNPLLYPQGVLFLGWTKGNSVIIETDSQQLQVDIVTETCPEYPKGLRSALWVQFVVLQKVPVPIPVLFPVNWKKMLPSTIIHSPGAGFQTSLLSNYVFRCFVQTYRSCGVLDHRGDAPARGAPVSLAPARPTGG